MASRSTSATASASHDPDIAWFAISDEPVSFGRFARLFRDALGCRNALFLDGAVSSLWDRPAGRRDTYSRLGPLVAVFDRSNEEERMMPFKGSCHCGAIATRSTRTRRPRRWSAIARSAGAAAPLHHFTTPDKFTLETPRDAIATYQLEQGRSSASTSARPAAARRSRKGTGPNGPMVEINLRCAEDIDLTA